MEEADGEYELNMSCMKTRTLEHTFQDMGEEIGRAHNLTQNQMLLLFFFPQ